MIRRDMPAVHRIEEESFPHPWSEEDFLTCLRKRNCIGMVAEYDGEIVGFMVYDLCKDRLDLLNVAVGTKFRRCGFGKAMLERLIGKLSQQNRSKITVLSDELNMDAHLFFADCGFRATGVVRDAYGEDRAGYTFVFDVNGFEKPRVVFRNRIKHLLPS